eukprot:4613632-Amphidinium_carterae.2
MSTTYREGMAWWRLLGLDQPAPSPCERALGRGCPAKFTAEGLHVLLSPAGEGSRQQILRPGVLSRSGVDSATEGLGDTEPETDLPLVLSGKQRGCRGPAPG